MTLPHASKLVTACLMAISLQQPALAAQTMKRGAPPSVAEAQAALAKDKDYHESVGDISKVLACVPAANEGDQVTDKDIYWWCLTKTRKAGSDERYNEIAFEQLPGDRKFGVLTGEFMPMCPPAASVSKALKPLITRPDVTEVLENTTGQPGHFAPADENVDDSMDHPLLYCDYYGKAGKFNYILYVSASYGADGYVFTDRSWAEMFNENGALVDDQGKEVELPD